jgi:alpha-N-arabinofuranosidase
VLQHLRNHADYISLHTYVGNRDNDYYDFLSSSLVVDDRTRITRGMIQGILADAPRSRKIHIAWDEWNVWYRARGEKERGRRILEERYNLEDALVVATFLNSFLNFADVVKMANMAQLVNVIAPMFTDEKRLFLQTTFFPLELFSRNSRGTALDLFVDSPTYKTKKYDAVPYLDASAAYENGSIVLNVVNRHKDAGIECDFVGEDKVFGGEFEVSEVNGPDIKAENDFDNMRVKTTRKSAAASGGKLRYTFPPHSYTMLKGKLS